MNRSDFLIITTISPITAAFGVETPMTLHQYSERYIRPAMRAVIDRAVGLTPQIIAKEAIRRLESSISLNREFLNENKIMIPSKIC